MLAGRRIAVLLSLSLAAALTMTGAASVLAFSHPAVPVASATLPDMRRSVVWYGVPQASPRTIHIESSSLNTSASDDFQITYSGGNFTLAYQRAANGPITNQYTLSVEGLVEWNASAGDGPADPQAFVAYTPLNASAFGRFPVLHFENTTGDGVHLNSFVMASNKGDVTLNLTIADGFVALPSGEILTPMEAKLTLEISHTMTRPDTTLSLQIGITTDQRVTLENQSWDDQNDFSTGDRALNISNDVGASASATFFAWSSTASVNGVAGPVTPSELVENHTTGGQDFYLSYARPASGSLHLDIVHDPTIGVVSAAYLSGVPQGPVLPFQSDALVYVVSLVAIAALVAGTAILVGRRQRKAP